MAGDDRALSVHQDRRRPPELHDAGRHLGNLLVRVRPRVLGVRQEAGDCPDYDLQVGEVDHCAWVLELVEGFEPPTNDLQDRCSAI